MTIVRGHLCFNVALPLALLALLLFLDTVLHLIPGILLGIALFNVGLLGWLRRRPRSLPTIAAVDIAGIMGGLLLIDGASDAPLMSIRAVFALAPMMGAVLVGHGSAWGFWALGSVVVVGLTVHHGVNIASTLDAVATSGVGLFVAGISWKVETARLQAAELAAARLLEVDAKAREALAASEAKSTFLATMSHEIRTPMNGVLGVTRMLLETEQTEEQRRLSQTVLKSGQSLMTVLNDVLDLSRLEAGRMTFEALPLAPERVAQEVCALLSPLAEERRNQITVSVAPDTPGWVRGDPTRLRQLLMNIIGNALKFTEVGQIEVRLLHRASILRLEVQDDGIGVPQTKLATLFDAFTQADNSTTRRFGGSGLGLAICQQLCEHMGGAIGARSAPGAGSTFWFELPFPACAPAEVTEAVNAALPPGLRVLVAEDHPVNKLVVERALRGMGCEVTLVDDGQQAIERVLAEPWDVVLMDCYMPVMDGFDATRAIRALGDERARIPILALTASATSRDRARVVAAGMDALLAKPLEPELLQAALAEWGTRDRVAA